MREKAHYKYHYCLNCWSSYKSLEYLNAHRKDCMINTACKIILPEKDKAFVEFKNYHKKLRLPFVIYADFEAFIINDNHKPCSIAMTLISDYPDIIKPETLMFKGDNLIFDFLTKLKSWQDMFYKAFKTDIAIKMTPTDIEHYNNIFAIHPSWIKRLETITIIQANIEDQHIMSVI